MKNIEIYSARFCPYCVRAKALLDRKGVAYTEHRLDRLGPEVRSRLVELTGRYTVPQILVDGEPIGGFDDMAALERAGQLDAVLGSA